jgi:hypothetical protein
VTSGHGVVAILVSAGQSALLNDMLTPQALPSANAGLTTTLDQGPAHTESDHRRRRLRGGRRAVLAILDAGTFAAALIALASIRVVESEPEAAGRESFVRDVLAGPSHLRATPVLVRITAAPALCSAVLGFFESVDFAVVQHGLHQPPTFLNRCEATG